MAARSFAYHAHGTVNPAVIHGSCAMPKHQISNARSGLPPDHKSSYVTYNYILTAVCQLVPVTNLVWGQDSIATFLVDCELKGLRVPVSLATKV